jgi:type II secretory pathway pseudopilin PulG
MTVVIGIIMVLLTMSVIGYRYIEASAARHRTRAALHDLEGMTAELDRTGGMVRVLSPTTLSLYQTNSQVTAPGDVTAAGGNQVTVSTSYSTNVIQYLVLVPANQQALSQMPAKSLVPGSYRLTSTNIQVSAVADGWGNPIIFVPPGGLTGVNLGATANSSGTISYARTGVTITSPDHRWFWASAGPDGNFANGDDNVYSFEK